MRRNWLSKASPQPRDESLLQKFLENAGWIDGAVLMTIQFGEALQKCAAHRGMAAKRPPRFCVNLSLSEIKSEHSDDVIRRELGSDCVRWPEQPVAAAHPCSRKGVFSRCCNRPYKKGGGDADAARRRRRHGQDIPAGSSQSAVPYGHSAIAIAARWADHECPWREAAV